MGSAGASPYRVDRAQVGQGTNSGIVAFHVHKGAVGRRKPATGVRIDLGCPTVVFVTVCTKDRISWLACEEAHQHLIHVWKEARTWLVGHYVLMPDHLHLFAAPVDLQFTIERWMAYWKSQFSKGHRHLGWIWQAHGFHRRLRKDEDYTQKWHYVRENPMREGLVTDPAQWPYQGMMNVLRW